MAKQRRCDVASEETVCFTCICVFLVNAVLSCFFLFFLVLCIQFHNKTRNQYASPLRSNAIPAGP